MLHMAAEFVEGTSWNMLLLLYLEPFRSSSLTARKSPKSLRRFYLIWLEHTLLLLSCFFTSLFFSFKWKTRAIMWIERWRYYLGRKGMGWMLSSSILHDGSKIHERYGLSWFDYHPPQKKVGKVWKNDIGWEVKGELRSTLRNKVSLESELWWTLSSLIGSTVEYSSW